MRDGAARLAPFGRATRSFARLPAPLLVLAAILSFQFGTALAAELIALVGPVATVAIRLDISALILLAIARPALRGRRAADWRAVLLLGLTIAAMNLAHFQAIARLPLGVVTTTEFLGPLGLAALASRRPRDLLAVTLALAGVVLVSGLLESGPDGLEPVGFAFALATGLFWALYILSSRSAGRRWRELDGLATAMLVAAALVTPLALADGGGGWSRLAGPELLVAGASVALLSSVIPYSLELLALRRIATGVFGVLMSLEPAIAAVAGFVVLGQALGGPEIAGVALVIGASALVMVERPESPATELAELG